MVSLVAWFLRTKPNQRPAAEYPKATAVVRDNCPHALESAVADAREFVLGRYGKND